MTKCRLCAMNCPSHEILDGKCPMCRDADDMSDNEIENVWQSAVTEYETRSDIDLETMKLWS